MTLPADRDEQARLDALQRAVQERDRRFREILENASLVAVTLDPRGHVTFCNDALLTLTGWRRDEVLGRSWFDRFVPGGIDAIAAFRHAIQTGTLPRSHEQLILTRARETRRIAWSNTLLRAPDGTIVGAASIGEDITERARALQALQESEARYRRLSDATTDGVAIVRDGRIVEANRAFGEMFGYAEHDAEGLAIPDLAVRDARDAVERWWLGADLGAERIETVGQRTGGGTFPVELRVQDVGVAGTRVVTVRDLTERRALDRMKNEFVSTVSHELRTPLTAIRGSLGLIEGGAAGASSEQTLKLVRIARSNADRLIRLINDILDLERIESGRLLLHITLLDPVDIVLTTLAEIQGMAEQHGVRLVADPANRRPCVGDRDQIIQVLTNLVSNAVKFSNEGATVRVRVLEGDVGAVRFQVEDRGRGIPADDLPKLFRKFVQLDASDTRRRGGTGLGLAISRSIVEQHGGTIGVHSVPDEGTRFWFDLPPAPPPRAPGPPRVLVVDAQAGSRQRAAAQLAGAGIACSEAPDAEAAARAVLTMTPPPDLIVLDLTRPGIDGAQLVSALRGTPAAATPLLVRTEDDLDADGRRDLTLGITHHLSRAHANEDDMARMTRALVDDITALAPPVA